MPGSGRDGMDNKDVSVEGRLEVSSFSGGWVLEAKHGDRYPLRGPIPGTFHAGDAVSVRGRLRPDLASIDMIGTVLEVYRLEKRPN